MQKRFRFKEVSRKFQGSFKEVSRKFQGSFFFLTSLFVLFANSYLVSQSIYIPPDYYPDDEVSNTHLFYENKGQIIGFDGFGVESLKYYQLDAYQKIYIQDSSLVSFIATSQGLENEPDSIFRIDMKPWKVSEMTTPVAIRQRPSYANFYYPHCSMGVKKVYAHDRIAYENWHDNVDLHITSNQVGHKFFFTVHPGGNPNNIEVKFEGQDSIAVIGNELKDYI